MRLLTFFLFAALLNVHATGSSQTITLSGKDMPIKQVFTAIEKQTGYFVFYNAALLNANKTLTLAVKDMPLHDFLNLLVKELPFTYQMEDKTILLEEKPNLTTTYTLPPMDMPAQAQSYIVGRVIDSSGHPIVGASVKLSPGNKGSSTNAYGEFRINNVNPGKYTVEVTLIGHETVIRKITVTESVPVNMGNIQLIIANVALDAVEVVSTGMFDRNKETFTGVTRTISGKELRAASRANILEGLNMLDPSFKIIRDINFGSDPNKLPKVEMRGSRSVPPPTPAKYSQQLKLEYEQDPNQPLFILDGFETSLSAIINLDVNRIASVTLLKDAASTALYGSRSANGVVIVETIRPVSGKIQVSYTANGTLAIPDLSGYNMMDAKELLRFQELTSEGEGALGPFAIKDGNLVVPRLKHDVRENAILKGVNSNWMKVPLRYAGDVSHSLSISGGDDYFTYNVGLTRESNIGVMKGSENSSNTGYALLTYRKNKINISNNLTIMGQKKKESPYGSFSDYVKIPRYYTVNTTDRYLEEQFNSYYNESDFPVYQDYYFPNPLYNAHLPYKNELSGLYISNNILANWDVLPFLRLSTGMQYGKSHRQSDYFISPLNTMFDNIELAQKGSYDNEVANDENYSFFVTTTFKKVYAQKHIINMNLRGETRNANINSQRISAVGFATTSEPLIYLANSYSPDSRPVGSTSQSRSVSLIGSLNYSYDLRYNLDFSYNLSGTTKFGSENPFKSFYSIGARWNIGKEAFLEHSTFINDLSIYANIGLTGNENAGNFGSRSTYKLNNLPSIFGEAVILEGLGNPQLDWNKTYNLSYSISGLFFKKVVSLSLSGYRNLTDPMIITMPLPYSVGIESVPRNIGKLTTNGLELILDAKVISTRNWTLNVGFNTPLYYKSEYSGLGNSLKKYNDSARNNNYMQRYIDGTSPDDVWAVRSIGIGQAKGFEVFLDKNGNYTYLFDINNEVPVGSSRAVSQGNFNVSMRYKRFTLSVYTQYIIEEMKFNRALYDKVENLTQRALELNQDKRALYVRWQKPGDDASFLGIANRSLGMSSRFLQKENSFFVDAINFNYDLIDQYSEGLKSRIKQKLGIQSINFGITTSKIFEFRLSNVKMEKGYDYPFQRSVSVNMNVTF